MRYATRRPVRLSRVSSAFPKCSDGCYRLTHHRGVPSVSKPPTVAHMIGIRLCNCGRRKAPDTFASRLPPGTFSQHCLNWCHGAIDKNQSGGWLSLAVCGVTKRLEESFGEKEVDGYAANARQEALTSKASKNNSSSLSPMEPERGSRHAKWPALGLHGFLRWLVCCTSRHWLV